MGANAPKTKLRIYFSDYFNVSEKALRDYGAFNISLVADLPLFIDPFLLFHSKNKTYQQLHEEIIEYLKFLRDKSSASINPGLLSAWYRFPEVKQNWLGFTGVGNDGHGLGKKFATALNLSLEKIFKDFGAETVTESSHLEKLCLVREGVGRDNISDFTTNLVKRFLLEYTQEFAKKNLAASETKEFTVRKVKFNYETEAWEDGKYVLPSFDGDYVLLTPRDLLTKDEIWINKHDLIDKFEDIPYAIPNEQLRAQLNNYFVSQLPKPRKYKNGRTKEPTREERAKAAFKTIQEFPEIIDYYIKRKEEKGEIATAQSLGKVEYSEELFLKVAKEFSEKLAGESSFYETGAQTPAEVKKRIEYLKECIEKHEGYKIFYARGGVLVGTEEDIQVMFKLVWYATTFSVDREVNNGRGPVDYKISNGAADSTLVEFKLASNKHLRKNLQKQLEIYKKANNTEHGYYVIVYFSEADLFRVNKILKELNITTGDHIILINARNDDKPSASVA